MAEFSKLITTNDGKALIVKMLAGSSDIDFTRVASSDTQYDITDLEALAELTNIRQTSLISHKEISNQLSVRLETSFTNMTLTTGYYMRTLGLYAVDPDKGEILYAATIETSGNCYMPPYNGVTVSGAVIKLITTVGNAENIHMDVDPAAVATISDLMRKVDIDGGDTSDTRIATADTVTAEFPVPDAGDTGKGFLGKMKKFCIDFNNFRVGIITLGKLVNNGQCTQPGFALDARYGKTLTDLYTQLNSNLAMKVLSTTKDDETYFKYDYMQVVETAFGVHFNFWLTTKIATPAREYALTHIIGLRKAIGYVTLPAIATGGQLCLVFPTSDSGDYTMRIYQDLSAGVAIYMGAFLPITF